MEFQTVIIERQNHNRRKRIIPWMSSGQFVDTNQLSNRQLGCPDKSIHWTFSVCPVDGSWTQKIRSPLEVHWTSLLTLKLSFIDVHFMSSMDCLWMYIHGHLMYVQKGSHRMVHWTSIVICSAEISCPLDIKEGCPGKAIHRTY